MILRHRHTQSPPVTNRRGVITLWIIVSLPVIFLLLGVVVDSARLWIARIELNNAVKAAALSGAKTWGEGGSTSDARLDAQTAGLANTVHGQLSNPDATLAVPVTLDLNESVGNPNDNAAIDGELVLGGVNKASSPFLFFPDTDPVANNANYHTSVLAQKSLEIHSIWGTVFGSFGPYTIRSRAVAIYDDGQPRIAHVEFP